MNLVVEDYKPNGAVLIGEDGIIKARSRVIQTLAQGRGTRAKPGGRNHEHPLYSGPIFNPNQMVTAPPAWNAAAIASNDNGRMVTWHRKQSSFAGFSRKTGRMVSGLGPHEYAKFQEFEVDPRWVDFEMQGVVFTLTAPDLSNAYTADYLAVDWDDRVHAGEIKASRSYYFDPTYSATLTAAANAAAQIGITFHRDTGDHVRVDPVRRANIVDAYRDVFTLVTPQERERVATVIDQGSGTAPMARVLEAIGGEGALASAKCRSLLCARALHYDLAARIGPDTPVNSVVTPDVITDIRALAAETTF